MNQLFYSLSDSTLRCYNKLPLLQHHSILTFFAEVNLRRSHIPLRTQPLSLIVQMPLKGSLFWLIPFFLFCNTVVVAWLWRMAINSEGGWRILQTSQKYRWPFDFRAIHYCNIVSTIDSTIQNLSYCSSPYTDSPPYSLIVSYKKIFNQCQTK